MSINDEITKRLLEPTDKAVTDYAPILCEGCKWDADEEDRTLENSQRLGDHGVELEACDE